MRSAVPLAVAAQLFTAAALQAQQDRQGLIQRARAEFDDSANVRLLMGALAPDLGAPDSLWTVAGYDLAAALIRMERPSDAALLLRWVLRHGQAWGIDRTWYPPRVLAAFDVAAQSVAAAPPAGDARITEETWQFPQFWEASSPGEVRVVSTARNVRIGLSNDTLGSSGDGALTLPSGTHELVISADDHESTRLVLDVLPGVATRFEIDLVPTLRSATHDAVASTILRITLMRGNQAGCGTGFRAAGNDGLVLTAYGLVRGAEDLSVATTNGGSEAASIAAFDESRDIAVLRVGSGGAGLTDMARADQDRYVWSVYLDGCQTPVAARTPLDWTDQEPEGVLRFLASMPPGAVGAPLVNASGELIGVVTGPTVAARASHIQDVLERARRAVVTVQAPVPRRFPWKFVAAGAGAAGLAFALLGGGGGGDGGSGPLPTTGGITISFPN
jgi:S1-C subfamily serine protease